MFNTTDWHGDPVERHLQFGEFWGGIRDPSATEIVMGKLSGRRAVPTTSSPSAGYVTVTKNTCYKWIFNAEPGDELALAFASQGPVAAAATWGVVGAQRGITENQNRFLSWMWTDLTEATVDVMGARAAVLGVDTLFILSKWHTAGNELMIDPVAFPSGINATVARLRDTYGLRVGLHMHPDIVWPCVGGDAAGLECLATGQGISPFVAEHADALMAEGLAPTYRSGPLRPTEDLSFWWGHDPIFWKGREDSDFAGVPAVAHNGNPNPMRARLVRPTRLALQRLGPCHGVAQHELVHGWRLPRRVRHRVRGFGGNASSSGYVPEFDTLGEVAAQVTLGMVLHPLPGGPTRQMICTRSGVWALELVAGKLHWDVNLNFVHNAPIFSKWRKIWI